MLKYSILNFQDFLISFFLFYIKFVDKTVTVWLFKEFQSSDSLGRYFVSKKNGTLIQYRTSMTYLTKLLYGTGSKFSFFEAKYRPEETELWNSLKNHIVTVLKD